MLQNQEDGYGPDPRYRGAPDAHIYSDSRRDLGNNNRPGPEQAYRGDQDLPFREIPPYRERPHQDPRQNPAYAEPYSEQPQAAYGRRAGARTGQRKAPRGPRRPTQMPLVLQQFLNDLRETVKCYLSGNPLGAFRLALIPLSLALFLVLNLLFFGFAYATAMARIPSALFGELAGALGSLADSFGTSFGPSWGKLFLDGMLKELIVLAIIFAIGFLFSYLNRQVRVSPLRLLQNLAVATFPHTLLCLFILLFSLILPGAAISMLTASGYILAYLYMEGFFSQTQAKRGVVVWPTILSFIILSFI